MHEIHGSNLNVLGIQFLVFPSMYVTVRTEYILSTNQVQSLLQTWYIVEHTCKSFGILSSSECVLSWLIAILVRTILYYAIVSYHLVLLCSGTYLLVMHLTILMISTFDLALGTSRSAQQLTLCRSGCTEYQIEMSKSSGSLGALQGGTGRYVPLQSSTGWYGTIA
jgi:hypothetical protein